MEEHMIISKAVDFKSNDSHSHKYSQKFSEIHESNRKRAKSQSLKEDPFQFFSAIASLIQIHQEQKMEKKFDGLAMICWK